MRMPRLWHGNMVASYEDLLYLEEEMGIVNRGATTEIIEQNTLNTQQYHYANNPRAHFPFSQFADAIIVCFTFLLRDKSKSKSISKPRL